MPVALERFANDFATTLSAGAASGDATITVAAAAPPSLQGAGQFRVKVDDEIMVVTSGAATTTWTVTRGAEGTTAAAHSSGVAVTHVLTQGALERWVPNYPGWMPAHNNLLFGSGDPAGVTSSSGGSLGILRLIKLWIPEAATVASLVLHLSSAGSALTANQCFGGVYGSDGSLIAKTADQSSAWLTSGVKVMALTAEAGKSLTLPGGPGQWVYVAVLSNGTTAPGLRQTSSSTITTEINSQLVAADGFRAATAGTAQTALPSSLPAVVAGSAMFFAGLV